MAQVLGLSQMVAQGDHKSLLAAWWESRSATSRFCEPMAAALGIAVSSLVGLMAGVLPALRTARLEPAEGLRLKRFLCGSQQHGRAFGLTAMVVLLPMHLK